MAIQYLVFGLTLACDRALPRLRPLASPVAAPDVDVRLDAASSFASFADDDWQHYRTSHLLTPDGEPVLRVFHDPATGRYRFRYVDATDLVVSGTGDRVWARWQAPNEIEDVTTYLLGPILGFILRLRGRLALHASAVVIDGAAIAFAGPGGSGKSTTAAAFAQRGHPVVTDDIVVLRRTESGTAVVEPDSPFLRLWPRSSELLYGSPDALPRLSATWDKRYLDLETRGYPVAREPQSLGAVYVLSGEPAATETPEIETLTGPRALITLLSNAYSNLAADADIRAAEFDLLTRLVQQIVVRRVRQPAGRIPPGEVCDLILADVRRRHPVAERAEA